MNRIDHVDKNITWRTKMQRRLLILMDKMLQTIADHKYQMCYRLWQYQISEQTMLPYKCKIGVESESSAWI